MATSHPVCKPVVSVIIPARNEERSLGACLESLVAQPGVEFEIIVVDDGSSDGTCQIARAFSGVRVIDAGPLPAGWGGKSNALATGAAQARAGWLLFTDADTVLRPGALARSLAEADQHQACLLSYSPQQEVHGFWEKAVMPVIFAELATTYRPLEVSDPKSPAAAANGQYLLISREAYRAVGGHAAVATDLLEDVALARAVKKSGRKIFFRYAADAVRTRMYRSFAQLREGWTKNLALLFPSPARLALLRALECALLIGSAAVAVVEGAEGRSQAATAAGLAALTLAGLFYRRTRKAHFSWDANLLAIFGLPVFAYLLVRSQAAHEKGTVTWKGRSYGAAGERPPSVAEPRSAGPPGAGVPTWPLPGANSGL